MLLAQLSPTEITTLWNASPWLCAGVVVVYGGRWATSKVVAAFHALEKQIKNSNIISLAFMQGNLGNAEMSKALANLVSKDYNEDSKH